MEDLLVAWYRRHGRDLPWRRTRDPYAILVSEVRRQQTQGARVIPRYRAWQGLGYNRRALNLHRAATAIATHGWPRDLTELPGVGPYTAAAIRNFAFGEPVLPVDVNVTRVARRTRYEFSSTAAQALMDLGATLCLARVPRCSECPLVAVCPSRDTRDEPSRKQGAFEGSFRQRRASVLRAVAEQPRPTDRLDTDAVDALARDGLVVVADGRVALPN